MKRGISRYLTPAMILFDMNIYLKIQFDTEIVIYYILSDKQYSSHAFSD